MKNSTASRYQELLNPIQNFDQENYISEKKEIHDISNFCSQIKDDGEADDDSESPMKPHYFESKVTVPQM
jgi:hypothetical protein